jgi:DnaK suppressor protein
MLRTNHMSDTQIQRFHRKLEASREETFRSLVRADQERRILDCDEPQDLGDRSVTSSSREFLFERSSQKRRLLRMIEDALRRIDNDEFGDCIDCGKPINIKRLEAMPWTECCLQCQEKLEQIEKVRLFSRLPSAAYASAHFME